VESRAKDIVDRSQFSKEVAPLMTSFVPMQRSYIPSQLHRIENLNFLVEESLAEIAMTHRNLSWPLHAIRALHSHDAGVVDSTSASDLINVARSRETASALIDSLNLTEKQLKSIRKYESVIEEEHLKLLAVRKCFAAARYRGWHKLDTVETWNEALTAVLSLDQTQRLLGWAHENEATINRAYPILEKPV